ncbi:HAD family hydrolase [Pseudonocardia sp. RS010]|uniref:HAD family hydrolase n=1 Tax=Pseudonocardia sp. RS010 TaxID=3385979 RepID=UPI0039A1E9BB
MSTPPPVQAVIFDLDGTLVQTRIASWEIFEQVNRRFRLGVDEPEQYFDLFRGNVYESIAKLCRDDVQAAEVKEAFLQLLRSDYTPPLVPGVTDVVRRLAGRCTLAVMSSNAMQVMRRVLTSNGLAFCFAHVFGGDVTPDKKTAIRTFLADAGSGFGRRCAADYDEADARRVPDPAGTVLVTDTAGDVRDALEVGIRVVGVAWGMHSVEELTAAGAEFVALWPQEITAYLLGDAAALSPGGACAVPTPAGTPSPGGQALAPPPGFVGARSGDCGCGCGGDGTAATEEVVATAAKVRRDRRRNAVAQQMSGMPDTGADATAGNGASPGAVDELLAAVRRVMQ